MVHPDLLHIWHLGTGRDFLASALVELVRAGYFPGRNQTLKLLAATKSLVAFAKANKYTLARKTITKKSLNWVSGEYPELKTKGYDTFVIGSWLASLVEARDCGIPDLSTALWASNNVLTLLAKSKGWFLTPQEYHQLGVETCTC